MKVTKKPRRRRCLARGCQAETTEPKFLCLRHWWQVPEVLRARVWNAYYNGDRRAKLRAVRAALEAIQPTSEHPSPPA